MIKKNVYTRLLGEWHCRHRAPKSETCSFIGPKPYTPAILQKSENVKKKLDPRIPTQSKHSLGIGYSYYSYVD